MRILSSFILVLFVIACGSDPAPAPQPPVTQPERELRPYTFVVTLPASRSTLVNSFEQSLTAITEKLAPMYGEVTVRNRAADDVVEQRTIIQQAIEDNVDGIALWPIVADELRSDINAAVEQGIAVVTLGVDVEQSKRNVFYGAHRNAVGARLADAAGKTDNAQVGVMITDDPNIDQLVDGFLGRASQQELNIIVTEEPGVDANRCADAVIDMLQQHPTLTTLVFLGEWPFADPESGVGINLSLRCRVLAHGSVQELAGSFQRGEVHTAVVWRAPEMAREAIGMLLSLASEERTFPPRNRARLFVSDQETYVELLESL